MINKFYLGQTVWYTITDFEDFQIKSGTVVKIERGSVAPFYELDNGTTVIEARGYATEDEAIDDVVRWCKARIGRLQEALARAEQLRLQAQAKQ